MTGVSCSRKVIGRWRCAIGSPLDELISGYMAPVLKDAGFKKRRARYWTIESPDGNLVIIQARPYDMGPVFGFHVEWAAVPTALQQFYINRTDSSSPKMEWGLINTRLPVPVDLRLDSTNSSLWWFDREKLEEFGSVFRVFLIDQAIPMWRRALIPSQIPELLKIAELRYVNQPAVADPLRVQLVIHIDDGDPEKLHQMIDEAEERFPSDALLAWLRRRLRDRESP